MIRIISFLISFIFVYSIPLGNQSQLMNSSTMTTTILNVKKYLNESKKNWFLVPQADGTLQWMNKSQIENIIQKMPPEPRTDLIIKFQLFTKKGKNFGEIISPEEPLTLLQSRFNPKYPTRMVIHGWLSDSNQPVCKLTQNAYLNRGNFNFISVDWSSISSSKNYFIVQPQVYQVGQKVAEFIDFLHTYGGLSFKDLYLIGHSLGAHISGFAGKYVKKGKINTIIGLDPADFLFSESSEDKRLATKDAEYVETIHTNTGALGVLYPIGEASFYPNGGRWQPGCSILNLTCSHGRSYEYYAESINVNNPFKPLKCDNFSELMQSRCKNEEFAIRMGGEPSNYGKANGIYYVETNSNPPFGFYEQ